MKLEHVYQFDLNGYVILPTAITRPHLQRLHEYWSENLTNYPLHDINFDWGKEWRDLIDLESVYRFLDMVYRSKFRLDHMFCADERFVSSGGNLHHGADMFDEGIYYWVRNHRIHSGLIAVQYAVSDIGARESHFCCIPGSHRANFPVPDRYRNVTDNPMLRHVFLQAGDALIFSEALVHGTFKVPNSGKMRSVFARFMNTYSYFRKPPAHQEMRALPATPNYSVSGAQAFSVDSLTQRQRQLVAEPAFSRGHAPVGGRADMEPVSVKAIMQGPRGTLFVKNPRGELELPGGRPEVGEGLEAALVREVKEECGLEITKTAYLGSQSCEIIPGKRVLLVFFWCEFISQDLVLSEEHTAYEWVDITTEKPEILPDFYWDFCQKR